MRLVRLRYWQASVVIVVVHVAVPDPAGIGVDLELVLHRAPAELDVVDRSPVVALRVRLGEPDLAGLQARVPQGDLLRLVQRDLLRREGRGGIREADKNKFLLSFLWDGILSVSERSLRAGRGKDDDEEDNVYVKSKRELRREEKERARRQSASVCPFHGRVRQRAVPGEISGILLRGGSEFPDAADDLRQHSAVGGQAADACVEGAGLEGGAAAGHAAF